LCDVCCGTRRGILKVELFKKKDPGGDIQWDGICGNIEERGDL